MPDGADYDLVVIGGGAGGLSAARAGIRRGARTALVADAPLGGECTFTGCIPSKTLLEAAASGESFETAMARVRSTVAAVAATETAEVLRAEGVEVIEATARFDGPRSVRAGGRRLRAGVVVIATGSRPALPSVPGLDVLGPLTNETVFELRDRPASMAVLGGGAVGVELAQAFARLGVAVSLLEARSRVLGGEEPEASAVVEEALTGAGVSLHTGASVVSAGRPVRGRDGVELEVDTGGSRRRIDADVLVVAAGRAPDLAGLDLEAAGVECGPGGWVKVGPGLRTSARHIWAVGDVCGILQLTHAADQMGRLAVGNALSHRPERRFRPEMIPRVVYTDPEVASVGTPAAGVHAHRGRTVHVPMTEVDRARTAARTEGFLRLSVGPRRALGNLAGGKVLGATIVAPRAGEMISEIALAMRAGLFPAQLALTSHAYPTWSVAIQQAAAQIFAR